MKTLWYDDILNGYEATQEDAISRARGLDWTEIESEEADYPHVSFIERVNGVGVYYCYGSDVYLFADECGL